MRKHMSEAVTAVVLRVTNQSEHLLRKVEGPAVSFIRRGQTVGHALTRAPVQCDESHAWEGLMGVRE
jgi:hypothetical protein